MYSDKAGGRYQNLSGQVHTTKVLHKYVAVAVVKKELINPLFFLNIRWAFAHPAHLLPPALWGILPVYGGDVQNIFLKMNSFFWILSFKYA